MSRCGAWLLVLLAPLVLSLPARPAIAAPDAVTSVACSASGFDGTDPKVFGPLPVGLAASCEVLGSGYQGNADVQADFGPGIPRVGVVSASASATSDITQPVFANSGGAVSFYFEIAEKAPSPFDPGNFPMYFEARGEGTLDEEFDVEDQSGASSTFSAYAAVPAAGITIGLQNVFGSETSYAPFDDSTSIDLPPNSPSNPFYSIDVTAACQVFAIGGFSPGSASCVAAIDPLIRFDQAAFDATHGSSSFPLDDYYSIVFSQNLPVPEPGATAQRSIALVALACIGVRRRRTVRHTV